jgi:phenylacetate-coenzyme A ligase PaaK-like adenylate-forming protein
MTVREEVWQQKLQQVQHRFPWYRPNLPETGVHLPEPLPYLDANALLPYYEDRTIPQTGSDSAQHIFFTSGTSSGQRKRIVYSEADEQYYVQTKITLFRRLLKDRPYRKACADLGTGHAATTATSIFSALGLDCLSIPFEWPIARHVEQIKQFRPEVLYTMPSVLEHLLSAVSNPHELGITKVILVGEICSPAWLMRIAERLHLKVSDIIDTYGSIEIGTIAYFCHDIGRYIVLDDLYAESLPLSEGADEPLSSADSVLVLTAFRRDGFPAIRFVTNDLVRDLRSMTVNGTEKMTFACISGRVGGELKHGEKISIYDVEQAVFKELREASVRMECVHRCLRVYIRSAVEQAEALERIRVHIRDAIPAIGTMIANGLLADIEVLFAHDHPLFARTTAKAKKIHS